jgi:beta-N-acetylhexosaminidase
LLAEDVAPYAALLPRLPAIMVGHGHYPAFDGEQTRPASLSRAVVTDLLRRQMGYDGLVVTDDLEMGAIAQWGTFEQAVVAALAAGADMLLVCHTAEKILAAHAALAGARIPTEESARRIEEFKQKWIGPKN